MSEEKPQITQSQPQQPATLEQPKEGKIQEVKSEPSVPTKKQASYTYWVDEKNKSRELPEQHRPKKIDPSSIVQNTPASNGPSHWNKLGTWEQRTISLKELNDSTSQAVKKWLTEKECQLQLTEVALEGEFKRIFSNNKRKIMYQLTGKITFEGDDLHLKITDLTCTGDQEYSVKGKEKEQKAKLQSVASKIVNVVVEHFSSYKE